MKDPLPPTVDDVAAYMKSLTYSDEPVPADAVPPPLKGEPMVARSVRWSLSLDQRVKAAAAAHGTTMSELIRGFTERALAELENDAPVSRAEVLRAIAALRPSTPPDSSPAFSSAIDGECVAECRMSPTRSIPSSINAPSIHGHPRVAGAPRILQDSRPSGVWTVDPNCRWWRLACMVIDDDEVRIVDGRQPAVGTGVHR